MLSLALLTLWPTLAAQLPPAQARALGPVRAPTTTSSGSAVRAELQAALDELPDETGLAVVVPDPAGVAERLAAATHGLEDVLPEWSAEHLLPRVRRSLMLSEGVAGVDPRGRVTVVLGLGDVPDVVRLPLADPARFAAWIREQSGGRPIATWGEDEVHAVGGEPSRRAACVVRDGAGWCQLGPSAGADPLTELRRVVDVPTRRLSQSSSMMAALGRLRPGGDLYVFARPSTAVEPLARAQIDRARAAQPYARPAERRALDAEARASARRLIARASLVRSAAGALTLGDGDVRAELELELSDRGAELARGLVGRLDAHDPILGWADTPSLGRLIVRLDPALAAEVLGEAHLRLPPQNLSGTLAVMLLGLDTQCPSAKRSGPRAPAAWPFVFPLAAAVGLGGPLDRARLTASLNLPLDRAGPHAAEDVLFRGRIHDGPVEGRIVSGNTLLVGTGHGAASAAARRWEALGRPARREVPTPFIDARVSLAAIGAALHAGAYDADTRPELHRLAQLYRAIQPVVARYPVARASAHVADQGTRLTVRLSVGAEPAAHP